MRWQIAALTHALGYTDFRALNRDDLVALTPEAATESRYNISGQDTHRRYDCASRDHA